MRVLIAGCGYVGSRLGTDLAAAGHKVWGLRRRTDALPAGIEGLAADLTEPDTLAQLPPGLDHVVYATAADGSGEAAYRSAYLKGLGNLLKALETQESRPRRFFFVSSTGVYGQQEGEWVDETSPTEPSRESGKILLAAEHKALAGPFPATVVRLGGIYGPGRTRLLRLAGSGDATVREDPPAYTNRIHRDDAAGLIAHLIALDTAAPPAGQGIPPAQIYLGVDRDPAPYHEVLDWLAERLGAARPRRTEGDTGVRRGGNKRCSSDRLIAAGYRFRYPSFRDGYEEMIAGL